MFPSKKFAAVGLLAWFVSYLVAKANRASRLRHSTVLPQQVTTWEGEGGNLPPVKPAHGQSALH